MDVHNVRTRSFNMSRIKNKDTKPEIVIRKHLFSEGFRYRLNVASLPGTPDLVLRKYKTILNINGCFWHGHQGCKDFKIPKTRTDWWNEKIAKTRERDLKNNRILRNDGWKVITIWECELKSKQLPRTLKKLKEKIKNAEVY